MGTAINEMRASRISEAPGSERLKLAELTSGVGALILGVGVGSLLSRHLRGLGSLVLIAGLLLHAWGMYDKHRLESGQTVAPWWATALYWVCWAALIAIAAYLILRLLL